MVQEFSHVNREGKLSMVDVTDKAITHREAIASGEIQVSEGVLKLVLDNNLKKGDVISIAKIAGILGVKQTANLIPLCHNILINKIDINIKIDINKKALVVTSYVKTTANTGIEMEALTGTSITLLCIYDMIKAVDKYAIINDIKLLKKSGGKSGLFIREGYNDN